WVYALPRLAADALKMRSASVRSFRYFFANRRDLHAIRARSALWGMGLGHVRTDLGPGALRRNYESDAGDLASSKTGAISLSWYGLVGAHRNPTAGLCDSATGIVLVNCRRNRLYDGSAIFR